jgi:hypothetical protein
MSVAATTWVWNSSKSEGADRLVLLALADFADESGRCFGSWGTMQRKTRLSKSTIARSLKRLEESGELKLMEASRIVNGRNFASVWQLPVQASDEQGGGVRMTPGGGVTMTPGWCHDDTPTEINYSSPSSSEPKAKKITAIPFSNKSLNPPSSSNGQTKSAAPRESVLGKGMSDDDWLDHLATLPQYRGVNVRAKFEHLLKWCADKGETATRQRLKVWLDKDAKQQRMAPPAPKIVKIVRDDFSELMQELATA